MKRTWPTIGDYAYDHPLYTPNRHDGPCWDCGETVAKGKGRVVRLRTGPQRGRYRIGHLPVVGECPAHTAATEPGRWSTRQR